MMILDHVDLVRLGRDLKQAREARGFTQQDAAEIIDVARTTITAIEKGTRRIKIDELLQLAQAYGRAVGDFLRTTRPASDIDFVAQFRGANRAEQLDLGVVATVEQLTRNYVELENMLDRPLPRRYPDVYTTTHFASVGQAAESVAVAERQRLGLGDGPIQDLRGLLEQEVGLRVFYVSFPRTDGQHSRYAGLYIYDELLGGIIAVNRDHPEERRRWTMAHEYAHFLAHRYQPDVWDENYQRLPQREQFADSFAAYFLMPSSSLSRKVSNQPNEKVTVADLLIWANYYGVSVQAMDLRLEELGVLPLGTWEKLRSNGFRVRDAQAQLGLQPIAGYDDMLPSRYTVLSLEAYRQELITESLLARFLQRDLLDVRDIIHAYLDDDEPEVQG